MKEIINKLSDIDKKASKLKADSGKDLQKLSDLYEEEIEEYRKKSLANTEKQIEEMRIQSDISIREMKENISNSWVRKISMLKTKYKESEEDIVDEMVKIVINYGNSR